MDLGIAYDSRYGQYIMHTKYVEVYINKDDMFLPYIDAKKPQDGAFVKAFWENFEGFSKKYITAANFAHKAQGMIGCPFERDFKSMLNKKK